MIEPLNNKDGGSSRGWRSAPRDLASAQPLSRNVTRLRDGGRSCSLACSNFQLRDPSPSARLGMTAPQLHEIFC
jgi:hypothetical protein